MKKFKFTFNGKSVELELTEKIYNSKFPSRDIGFILERLENLPFDDNSEMEIISMMDDKEFMKCLIEIK